MPEDLPDPGAIDALVEARHGDPFALLGPHPAPGGVAIRAFLPQSESVEVIAAETGLPVGRLARIHPAGFWTGIVRQLAPYRLRIAAGGEVVETEDPYAFPPVLGDLDVYLLGEGRHHDFARAMGAHVTEIAGVRGVRFAVWAPNAQRVSVVGDFNAWDGRRHPMRLRHGAGVWELFIPRIGPGTIYKYEIRGPHGEILVKADPVAWATEMPPATASVVYQSDYTWADDEWL
ncbi:MAG TPA: 1,4-alpha-glucan branching enzyme, partial [Acetobacteraceae bacterium]|nr:1,4-alpha-glucan branching enzyme [Acetobacteraceae bacterium]